MKIAELDSELCAAAFDSDCDKIKSLLAAGAKINALGDRMIPSIARRTPLWIVTVSAGQELSQQFKDFVEAIQIFKPDLPTRNNAQRREQAISTVKLLLQSGADLEIPSWGTTPLWQAAHWTDPEVAELLLKAGANPNAESVSTLGQLATKKGRITLPAYFDTVLHKAVEKCSPAIVELLLNAGALPLKKNHEGKTPIDIADEKGFYEVKELLLKTVK